MCVEGGHSARRRQGRREKQRRIRLRGDEEANEIIEEMDRIEGEKGKEERGGSKSWLAHTMAPKDPHSTFPLYVRDTNMQCVKCRVFPS